jgi:hypothetical protein
MYENWVCIGHSHVAALDKAAGGVMDVINFWEVGDLWAHRQGPRPLREDLAERVLKGEVVVSAIGAAAEIVLGMVEHEEPFDFVLSSSPDLPLDETRRLLPHDAVGATLNTLCFPLLQGVSVLAGLVKAPLVHLAPPPPLAVIYHPRTHFDLPRENFVGQTDRPAPKWIRYKIWRLHCDMIEDYCGQHGVKFLRPPSEALDDEGFLRPEFDADGMHGTTEYGKMVLENVRRTL